MNNEATPAPPKMDSLPDWAKDIKNLPIQVEPCQDLVVVFPDVAQEESRGGVQRATITRGNMELCGTVIAKGPGKNSDFTGELIPIDWVQVGARYTYSKFAGDDTLMDSEGRLTPWLGVMHDDHIIVKTMRAGSLLFRIL